MNSDRKEIGFLLKTTETFDSWLEGLRKRNRLLSQRVTQRMKRMSMGNLGDVKGLGDQVSEARIFSTPALRLYFTMKDNIIIILLCGGGKEEQQKDIEKAKSLAKQISEDNSYEIENV